MAGHVVDYLHGPCFMQVTPEEKQRLEEDAIVRIQKMLGEDTAAGGHSIGQPLSIRM
jgi:hypothetical protein